MCLVRLDGDGDGDGEADADGDGDGLCTAVNMGTATHVGASLLSYLRDSDLQSICCSMNKSKMLCVKSNMQAGSHRLRVFDPSLEQHDNAEIASRSPEHVQSQVYYMLDVSLLH
jgi:hypothetical protein